MASDGRDPARPEDALLRRVADKISAMLAYWDSNRRCRFANRAYERWFGVSPEALIGKHISELLGPLYALNLPYIEGALRGEPQEFEREIPDPAGGPSRHSLASYMPDIVDGVVRGFFVLVTDISEIKRSEMEQHILAEAGAVFASSLDYRQTLDSIARLIVRHLADLCVVDMLEEHASVRRLTVVHADPAMASVCEKLGALRLDPRHTLAWSALETKQIQVFHDLSAELLASRARDQEHHQLLQEIAPRSALVVPLLSGGSVLGALVLASSRPGRYGARDVGLATELARRAALALENARLLEAERRARQARDEVLAIVAHDVRSPLSSILLAARTLEVQLAEAGAPTGDRSIQVILRGVRRASRLIDDLLDLTRIEAGVLSVALDRLDASQVVGETAGSQRLLASAASIELQLEVAAELPAIWADRDRLLQILENLIGNAIKFTPRGGRITVRAAPGSGTGEVLFSVTDTGPGISAESLSHIFDRFWQANRAERHGAGLGLAICKGLVEAHGGRLWVESTPGRGSTFWFTIPAAPPVAPRAGD